jgi:Tol biopolymer transport system component
MSNQRWRRVEELYHAALERPPENRSPFLKEACGGDAELRREVESLLRHEGSADPFLEAPAKARAASGVPMLIPEGALSVGAMVGPYRVEMPLGSGGMGEVYRAHDTKLGRDIVLKTLPAAFAGDPAYMARFRREAQVLASLNHPNIATLHGLEESAGVSALVMELVDGETLAQRLTRGALPWRETLPLALQAAEGVEAAHQKGIIHRDLKPGNVMVNAAGRVKVLDFGLSRRTLPGGNEQSTRTVAGTVLGTVAYMAPEQAEGRDADERSDIFAFGAVLYEMLTGQRAFGGDSLAGTLSSVLRDEPSAYPPGVPKEVVRVVKRCLEKVPARRYQSMTDVKFALQDAREDQERRPLPAPVNRRPSAARWLFPGLALAAAAAGGWFWGARRGATEAPPMIVVPLAEGLQPAVSPDGKMAAFIRNGEEGVSGDVYVKVLGSGPALRLTHDPAPERDPVWSPDGRQIAFSRLTDAASTDSPSLFVVPVLGGAERSLGLGSVQDWSPDGSKLLVLTTADAGGRGYYLVSVGDGSLQRLATARPGERLMCARFSTDGRSVYFVRGEVPGRSGMFRVPVTGGNPEPIPIAGIRAIWNFRILPKTGEFLLVGVPEQSIISMMWRVGLAGGEAKEAPFGRNISSIATSADGSVVMLARIQTTSNIQRVAAWPGPDREPQPWIASAGNNLTPVISPDQTRIAFASDRSGMFQIWASRADGKGPVALTQFNSGAPGIVGSPTWSPDGAQVAFDVRTSNADIWVVSVKNGVPRQLTTGTTQEMLPVWSKDGRWIYFTSNQSGQHAIWRISPGGGTPQQVTRNGGYGAQLSPDGRRLYYLKNRLDGELWQAPADGGTEELVLRNWHGRNFHVLEDGIYLLDRGQADELATTRARAMFYRFRTRQLEDLHFQTRKPVSPYGIDLSADGKWLYYSEFENLSSDLMVVENFR